MITISKATKSFQPRHGNYECKEVIYDGIEEFINHHPPRQMSNRFKLIIDVELGSHVYEPYKLLSMLIPNI